MYRPAASGARSTPPAGKPAARLWWCAGCCLAGSLILLGDPGRAFAQLPGQSVSSRSYSGQFLVQAPASILSAPSPAFETNRSFVRLEPALLSVGCERVRQILWRELGCSGPWLGKVFVGIYPAMAPNDPVTLVADVYPDGWQYRLRVPNVIDRTRCMRALVNVVLLEIANREAKGRCAELPAWLVEGFAQELIATKEAEILLSPPRLAANGIGFNATPGKREELESPLVLAHRRLAGQTALSFEQLSWPAEAQLEGAEGEFYRANALLLVEELLRLPDGRACLRDLLAELPRHYNWQFAFLRAFAARFQRPLDVEKWWTLTSLHFSDRDLSETWSGGESWQKLDEVIRSAVQVQQSTNQIPSPAQVSLQTIVQEWERPRQQQVLRQKLFELNLLRQRVSGELLPVVDEYRRVLTEFVDAEPGGLFRKKIVERHWREQTLKELNRLDVRREELRVGSGPVPALQAGAPGTNAP